MVCANVLITLLALVVLVFTFWPALLSAAVVKWIVVAAAALIIIAVWTGCKCVWCDKTGMVKK